MTEGPGSTPDVPPGWAAQQPPAYGQGSWAAPGFEPPGQGDGQQGPGPYNAPHGQVPPGYQPGYGQGYGSGYGPPPQAPRPGIIPLRPLALGDILDGTIKLIRTNPRATLGLSAIVAAISTVPLAIGQAFYFRTMSGLISDPTLEGTAPLSGLAAQYIGQLISLIMTFVATTILTGILTRVLGRSVFGGRITVGEAWRLSRSRVPALFGLVLLIGLILVLPLLVIGAVVFLLLASSGALDGLAGGDEVGVIFGVALIMFLAYIPYLLFFNTRFALAGPAVVLEGRGATDAMRRSWRLVKGDSWRVLGILLLTGLLAGIISAVLSVPFSFGGSLLGLLGEGSTTSVVGAAILVAIGSVLGAMIAYPFQAGVNGLLYTDRRMRAEAFDLVLQTAALQNQNQGWIHSSVDDLWHPSNAANGGAAGGPYGGSYGGSYGGPAQYGTPGPGEYGTPPATPPHGPPDLPPHGPSS